MKVEKLEDFIKEPLEEGFIKIESEDGKRISNDQLTYMSPEMKDKYFKKIENTPQVILYHPETKVIVEVFEKDGDVTKANAIVKYAIDPMKDNRVNNDFDTLITGKTIIQDQNLVAGRFINLKKIELDNSEEIYEINYIMESNARQVNPLKIEFNDKELNVFTAIQAEPNSNPRDKVNKLNNILGNEVDNIVFSNAGTKLKIKNK